MRTSPPQHDPRMWQSADERWAEAVRQRDVLLAALNLIAYDPFGRSDASAAEVLDAITMLARDVVREVKAEGR